MKSLALKKKGALVLVVAAMFAAAPVMAQSNKSAKQAAEQRADKGKPAPGRDNGADGRKSYFEERQRVVLRQYFEGQNRNGRCPPGLAKKNNGCQPPGQAKKWEIGRPLPRDVIFHSLPRSVEIEIGLPPAGHRYVRVAADILLIAIGTGMVIDAIEDIMR